MRILLVDDNSLVAQATMGALAAAGHRAEWAVTAEAALLRHQPGIWDFVLTDIRLPGIDGWQLIARLHEREPRLPVGVITGWPPLPGDPSAAERGARFLLVKPVDPAELVSEIARVADLRVVAGS